MVYSHLVDLVAFMMGGPFVFDTLAKGFCIPGREMADVRVLSKSDGGARYSNQL